MVGDHIIFGKTDQSTNFNGIEHSNQIQTEKKANAKLTKLNNKRHNPKFRCEFGRVTVVYLVGSLVGWMIDWLFI